MPMGRSTKSAMNEGSVCGLPRVAVEPASLRDAHKQWCQCDQLVKDVSGFQCWDTLRY